jgi:hypothetical protein
VTAPDDLVDRGQNDLTDALLQDVDAPTAVAAALFADVDDDEHRARARDAKILRARLNIAVTEGEWQSYNHTYAAGYCDCIKCSWSPERVGRR